MKVIRNDKVATLTLVPVEKDEHELFTHLIPILKKGDKFIYGNREDDGNYCKINLYFGSTVKPRTQVKNNVTIEDTVMVGGVRLTLKGTTNGDKSVICGLRDSCYFGGCSPIFLNTSDVDGVKSIVITLGFCKHCQAQMISCLECEWLTCNACATKCRHKYERGMIHGGVAGTGAMGKFCKKCGRTKPRPKNERVKTDAENKVEIEQKFGIIWNYTNVPFTPAQIVAAEKAAGIIPK
ncbi:MAG: hypothetical protein WC666_00305 [Candidatus Paceibacterota bacterium]|jgi:hypothetical protein